MKASVLQTKSGIDLSIFGLHKTQDGKYIIKFLVTWLPIATFDEYINAVSSQWVLTQIDLSFVKKIEIEQNEMLPRLKYDETDEKCSLHNTCMRQLLGTKVVQVGLVSIPEEQVVPCMVCFGFSIRSIKLWFASVNPNFKIIETMLTSLLGIFITRVSETIPLSHHGRL